MYFDQDNNYFDDIYDLDNKTYNNYDIDFNFNRNNTLEKYDSGFNKGNMFSNLYKKYKNHEYKLKVNNKKDECLYKLQMYTFALKDIALYLDTHPTDESMLLEFQKTKRLLEEEKKKYENMYGQLCIGEIDNTDKWVWINNPWPWDKGGK